MYLKNPLNVSSFKALLVIILYFICLRGIFNSFTRYDIRLIFLWDCCNSQVPFHLYRTRHNFSDHFCS